MEVKIAQAQHSMLGCAKFWFQVCQKKVKVIGTFETKVCHVDQVYVIFYCSCSILIQIVEFRIRMKNSGANMYL